MIENITKETSAEKLLSMIMEISKKKIFDIDENIKFYQNLDASDISENVKIRREEVINSFSIQKFIYVQLLGDICYFKALKNV